MQGGKGHNESYGPAVINDGRTVWEKEWRTSLFSLLDDATEHLSAKTVFCIDDFQNFDGGNLLLPEADIFFF